MPVASYKVTASVILQNQSTKIQNQQLATALRTGLNSFKHLWERGYTLVHQILPLQALSSNSLTQCL